MNKCDTCGKRAAFHRFDRWWCNFCYYLRRS